MDVEELSQLIELYGNAVYRFCQRLAGSRADADDLYQETFLKAMEARHKIDMSQNPGGFLISIAIGLHKNHRRKFAWRKRIAPVIAVHHEALDQFCRSDGEETPEQAALAHELRSSIQAAADRLNDKLRVALYMYYTAEMSVDEIAVALNIPAGTVKSRLYQARKAMKKILEAELS